MNRGVVQLAAKRTAVNRAALRAYFIANIMTFFLAVATAVYCLCETMPAASPQTARRIVVSLLSSTCLLLCTVVFAGCTFLSGAYAVYPADQYSDLIPPAIIACLILLVVFSLYSRRVWDLFFRWRRAQAAGPFPNLIVTMPEHSPADRLLQLRSILTR